MGGTEVVRGWGFVFVRMRRGSKRRRGLDECLVLNFALMSGSMCIVWIWLDEIEILTRLPGCLVPTMSG